VKSAHVALAIELLNTDGKGLPTEFRLFKTGKNKTLKGDLVYSKQSAIDCAAFQEELGRDCMVDYEHASLNASSAIDPAKAGEAAGFFRVEPREDGLYASNVTWVDDAAARLTARKFRYFSPVVYFDPKTKEITGIFNAALTNNPATRDQTPLVASLNVDPVPEPKTMKTLLAALALAVDATEAEALSSVEKIKTERTLLLAATGKDTVAEASGAIAAWKAGSEKAAELSAKLEALEGVSKKFEVDTIVKKAVEEKRAAPAQVEVLTKMGMRDIAELKSFLEASPKLLGEPAKQAGKDAGGTDLATLSAEEKAVLKQTGTDPVAYLKTKARIAALDA
jgi:phage I-like protein